MKVKCTTHLFNYAGFYYGHEYEIVDFQHNNVNNYCEYEFILIGDKFNYSFYKENLIEYFGMTEESVMNLINKLMIFK